MNKYQLAYDFYKKDAFKKADGGVFNVYTFQYFKMILKERKDTIFQKYYDKVMREDKLKRILWK